MRKALIVASVMSCSRLAFGETVLDHATVGLRTSDSAWSPGTGFGVVLSNRLQLPDDAVVTKFELEIGPMVTNYPLCGLELTLRWDPFHVATVAFGESCAIPITPGLLMTIAPPDRAFEYFMGLTSQRNREQSLEAAGGFNAPPQVLLHFTGSVELRAVGVAGSVGVSHQSWAATKARYR